MLSCAAEALGTCALYNSTLASEKGKI